VRRWLRRIGVALAAIVLVTVVAWHIAIRVVRFPLELLDKTAATSLSVYDDNGLLLRQEATSAGLRDSWLPLDRISPYLVAATLASEDTDFYDHGGVDWPALARAAWLNTTAGGVQFGGSANTNQPVRPTAQIQRPPTREAPVAGKPLDLFVGARLLEAKLRNTGAAAVVESKAIGVGFQQRSLRWCPAPASQTVGPKKLDWNRKQH